MKRVRLLVNQIKISKFARLIFIFLIGLSLALLIFGRGHLSFKAVIVFRFQHFSIRFVLFLSILKLACRALLASLFHALYEFILKSSSLSLIFLWQLIKIFQQLVCAFPIQLILFLFKLLLKLLLFQLLPFS